jgi:HlyD family secretion protein
VSDSVFAAMDLNKYEVALLQKDQLLAQVEERKINSDLTAHNKRKEILDLKKQVFDQQQKFYTALLLLKSQTAQWLKQYVLTASEEGIVFFLMPLQEEENVVLGQELFYIQAPNTLYNVHLLAGQNGFGKVKEGQQVRLKVMSYPSEQYGYLRGIIVTISDFPNRRDSFFVNVSLPDGLRTVHGKELFFRNNLLAAAEIITENHSLFDRLFEPLRKVW